LHRAQPYANVFDIDRFRETEVIHGRWAMLAALGALFGEIATGVNWVEAGKYELDNGSVYFGLSLPFDLTQLSIITALSMGYVEVLRNNNLDLEKRVYPGGFFDPLKLASEPGEQTFRLRTAEIKHSRLAMVAFFGYAVQATVTKTGSLLDNLSFLNN
jgi:light-harvesting complex II chlorophyll a/b binding protein 4